MTGGLAFLSRNAGRIVPRFARACVWAGAPDVPPGRRRAGGYSMVELLLCLALATTLAAIALVDTRGARQRRLVEGAARHLALALRAARLDAVGQGRSIAVQFLEGPAGVGYRVVADGNGNGVRRAEIERGIDPVLRAIRRPGDDFAGVSFAVGCQCPGIDDDRPATGVQFGEAGLAVFTPAGTATSGTAYLTGAAGVTYAVRVLGATGRTRILRFDSGQAAWVPP